MIFEYVLVGELIYYFGYEKGEVKLVSSMNYCNGISCKCIMIDDDLFDVEILCDCEGIFDLVLIVKGEWCFIGFDDKIIVMYVCGMSVWEI